MTKIYVFRRFSIRYLWWNKNSFINNLLHNLQLWMTSERFMSKIIILIKSFTQLFNKLIIYRSKIKIDFKTFTSRFSKSTYNPHFNPRSIPISIEEKLSFPSMTCWENQQKYCWNFCIKEYKLSSSEKCSSELWLWD